MKTVGIKFSGFCISFPESWGKPIIEEKSNGAIWFVWKGKAIIMFKDEVLVGFWINETMKVVPKKEDAGEELPGNSSKNGGGGQTDLGLQSTAHLVTTLF